MKIKQEIYNEILYYQRTVPPETGGILGGCNGIICANHFDEGLLSKRKCSYVPNVKN
mgnify:CR=1 FL=1